MLRHLQARSGIEEDRMLFWCNERLRTVTPFALGGAVCRLALSFAPNSSASPRFAVDGRNFARQSLRHDGFIGRFREQGRAHVRTPPVRVTFLSSAPMRALIPLPRQSLSVWVAAFFSPTAYFLVLLLADTLGVPSPPESFVASLFYLLPAVALLVCGSLVWWSSMTVPRKIRWLLLTLFAILLQTGVLLAILIAGTGYAPT
jgi:hypothetical protein